MPLLKQLPSLRQGLAEQLPDGTDEVVVVVVVVVVITPIIVSQNWPVCVDRQTQNGLVAFNKQVPPF